MAIVWKASSFVLVCIVIIGMRTKLLVNGLKCYECLPEKVSYFAELDDYACDDTYSPKLIDCKSRERHEEDTFVCFISYTNKTGLTKRYCMWDTFSHWPDQCRKTQYEQEDGTIDEYVFCTCGTDNCNAKSIDEVAANYKMEAWFVPKEFASGTPNYEN